MDKSYEYKYTRAEPEKDIKWAVFYQVNPKPMNGDWMENGPSDCHGPFKKVAEIYAPDKDDVFARMQGEVWSPNGQARLWIEELGLSHTSMMVGDITVNLETEEAWMVMPFGWALIKKAGK